ncbi:MAG: glutamine synthetase family protein [Kiloniellaceae bacterium]
METRDKVAKAGGGSGKAARAPKEPVQNGPVHLGIFDFTGAFREKRLSRKAFDAYRQNGWAFIDALPYWLHDETCFTEKGFVDEPVTVDPTSLRPYPFEPDANLAIADYSGPSQAISPRATLKAQLDKAEQMGFQALGGFEFETIYLEEDGASLRAKGWRGLDPAFAHNRCWSGVSPAADADFLAEIHAGLLAAGIDLDHHCAELGPGCFEYSLGPSPFLKAADDAALFKIFTKALARQRGLTASFMAQLDDGFPGLCGHINVSLRSMRGQPVFHDAKDQQGLSTTAKAFLGGLTTLTPDLMGMFAPTVNAYRRLRPGNWAPRSATWGLGNYSCGVRVVAHSPEETRFEFRLPGADVAPHTAAAMVLGAGLWGSETAADPGAPVEGNGRLARVPKGRVLPTSLEEAARRLAASKPACAIFGAAFVDHYAAWCAAEATAFYAHVSAFERARYLETL